MALSLVTAARGGGGLTVLRDTVPNAPSKTFDYTADIAPLMGNAACVQILYIHVLYAADAGGGARELTIDILDSSDAIVLRLSSGSPLPGASQTQTFTWAPGLFTSVRDVASALLRHEELPFDFRLCQGLKLKVHAAAGSVGTDDMDVVLHLATVTGFV